MSNRREAFRLNVSKLYTNNELRRSDTKTIRLFKYVYKRFSKKLKSHHALIKQTSRSQGALILEFSWYYKHYAPMELVYCKSYNALDDVL